jgi:hypothetical protein
MTPACPDLPQAACYGLNGEWATVEAAAITELRTHPTRERIARRAAHRKAAPALTTCGICPARTPCLEWAVSVEYSGIAGGQLLRDGQPIPNPPPTLDGRPHPPPPGSPVPLMHPDMAAECMHAWRDMHAEYMRAKTLGTVTDVIAEGERCYQQWRNIHRRNKARHNKQEQG